MGLFGNWLKWLLLTFITLGIYLFWVGPRITQSKWEHTDFDRSCQPLPLTDVRAVAAVPVMGMPAVPGAVPTALPGQA